MPLCQTQPWLKTLCFSGCLSVHPSRIVNMICWGNFLKIEEKMSTWTKGWTTYNLEAVIVVRHNSGDHFHKHIFLFLFIVLYLKIYMLVMTVWLRWRPPTAWTLHPPAATSAPVVVETVEKKIPKGVPLQFDINSVGKPVRAACVYWRN